jgi:hypothetical protein
MHPALASHKFSPTDWLDTLNFANRVEWLGIGVYGSRHATPGVDARELSTALIKVLADSEEAVTMRRRARELAEVSAR